MTKTNWYKFETYLSRSNFEEFELSTHDEIEYFANHITAEISEAIANSTKTFQVAIGNKQLLVLPEPLLDAIKFKRKVKRKANKTNSNLYRTLLNALNRKIDQAVNMIKEENLLARDKALAEFNSSDSKHWTLLKKFENNFKNEKKKDIKLLHQNKIVSKESEIAEMFADSLNNIFGLPPNIHLEDQLYRSVLDAQEITISEDEFTKSLKKLNDNAAPGIDKISNSMLKKCPSNVHQALLRLFNASLKLAYIPKLWKSSKIIMIPKPPDE